MATPETPLPLALSPRTGGRGRAAWLYESRIVWSVGFLLLVLLIALLVPWLGADPTEIHVALPLAPIGALPHWLGTDDLGRDLLARLAVGARISLAIGLLTAVVAVFIGTLYGIISAQGEGALDQTMMRVIDVLYSLPGLMVVILFSVFLEPAILNLQQALPFLQVPGAARMTSLVLALAFFSWPDTARIIRGQMLALKREAFIEAFHSLGGGLPRLILRHYLPNLAALVILTATITVPRAILTESTLSFIGLGVEPPLSSWGTLASDGWQLVRVAPHLLILPALFIFVSMVALNVLGDALRQQLDPKQGRTH